MTVQRADLEETKQISLHHRVLYGVLWRRFSVKEPWALVNPRIPSNACGLENSIWIRYVWTGKFLNPERKSCGFKNIRTRVDGALALINILRLRPYYAGGIWKRTFISTIRPAVHTNLSLKRSFMKARFKPEEFKNVGFAFSCAWKTFWKRSFSKTMTSR